MKFFHTITRFAAAIAVVLLCGAGIARAEWTELPNLPVAQLWGATAHHLNGKIYVIGGAQGSTASPAPSSIIYSLDLASPTPTWQTVTNMPTPLFIHSSAVINGKIYIFGGINGSNAENIQSYIFDPATGLVTTGAVMPRPNLQAPAVVVGTRAYILGGITRDQNNQQVYSSFILVYDANGGTWQDWTTQGKTLPYPGWDIQATTIGSTIYLIGGRTPSGNYIVTHKGTVTDNGAAWERVADYPSGFATGAASVLNNQPLVAGGSLGSTALLYNIANNTWDTYNSLPIAEALYPAMTSDGTNAYFVGGINSNKVFKADNVLSPGASVPRTNFRIAVKTGTQSRVMVPINSVGSAPLTANFEATGTAWATSAGGITIPAGSQGKVRVNLDASGLAAGRYSVQGQIVTNDAGNASVPVTLDVWVVDDLVQEPNVAVLEESHGTWCPPCGEYGVPAVEALSAQYGEQLVVLSYHDKGGNRYDPFSFAAGEAWNSRLGLNAYPTGAVQRWQYNGAYQLGAGAPWASAIADVLGESEFAKASIEVSDYVYNPANRQVTGNVTITTGAPIDWSGSSSLRVTAVVIESGYQYTQQFISKAPESIAHKHVARHFWPSADGQQVTIGSDATVDGGTLLKPGLTYTVPFSFTVPESTTPTSAGDISSLPITPANCDVVFLVHTNNGSTPGPILGAYETELVQGTVGPAVTINFPGPTTKEIDPQQTAEFSVGVTNHRNEPVEVTISRATNSMPTGWTSEICTGSNDCDDADQINFTIPANGTHTFTLKVHGTTPEETGNVRLVVSAGGVEEDQTYTVNTTSASSVAVPGEVGGLSMTEVTPNPASNIARVSLMIPTGAQTILEVYSISGEKIATLFEGRLEAGSRQIDANVSSLESGKYVLVLTSGDKKVSRTLTIVR